MPPLNSSNKNSGKKVPSILSLQSSHSRLRARPTADLPRTQPESETKTTRRIGKRTARGCCRHLSFQDADPIIGGDSPFKKKTAWRDDKNQNRLLRSSHRPVLPEGYADPVKLASETKAKKRPKKGNPSRLYCVCQNPYDSSRAMIQCDRCFNWFHFDCVHIEQDSIPKTYNCEKCSPRIIRKERPWKRLDTFVDMLLQAAEQQDRKAVSRRVRPEALDTTPSKDSMCSSQSKAVVKEGFVYLIPEEEDNIIIGPQTTRLAYKPRDFADNFCVAESRLARLLKEGPAPTKAGDVRQMIDQMRAAWQFGHKRLPSIYQHCEQAVYALGITLLNY